MQKVFILFISAIMVISAIFWFLSHAPCKKNQNMTMDKIRKFSTVFLIASMAISLIYLGDAITTATIVPSLIICHIAFDGIIKKL